MAFFAGVWDSEFCRAYLFDEVCFNTQHFHSRVHGSCQSKLQEGRSLDRQWEHRKSTTFICEPKYRWTYLWGMWGSCHLFWFWHPDVFQKNYLYLNSRILLRKALLWETFERTKIAYVSVFLASMKWSRNTVSFPLFLLSSLKFWLILSFHYCVSFLHSDRSCFWRGG